MTEKFNPFDPDNFSLGVGWDGKTVTVTDSKFVVSYFGLDENPWIDPNTGERGYSNDWAISGVYDDAPERTEKYSIGKSLVPSADGNSFESANGKPGASFHPSCKAAKLAKALKEIGFPLDRLVDDEGRPNAAGLVGAKFTMKGNHVFKANGEPKMAGKYQAVEFWPVSFEGFGANAAPQKSEVDDAVRNRAYDLVTQLLEEADGNKLTRIQLIQGVSKALTGDPELNAIQRLVVSDAFNSTAPWKLEGTSISL